MELSRGCDVTRERVTRVEQLRASIAAGAYAPDPDAVAESVLAWAAPPTMFDGSVKKSSGRADSKAQTAKDHHSRR